LSFNGEFNKIIPKKRMATKIILHDLMPRELALTQNMER
jgi:hypothetical protein